MNLFLQRFGPSLAGVLHGFDRLRFRGSKRQLCFAAGLASWLGHVRIFLKDYMTFVRDTTATLCQAIEAPAKQADLYCYLNNAQTNKEDTALQRAAQHGRTQGLIAVLGCVEPCQIVRTRLNFQTKQLELQSEPSKCKHYYHYYLDPDYGLRYTRLQTWFPFTMHIGLNGRDWLAQQLTQAGIAFTKKDNCFPWIEDFAAAQQLANAQLTTDWPQLLTAWAQQSNPLEASLLACPVPYFWSVEAGEYATDFAFRSAATLQRLYPLFVQHAYATLQSRDVLRFLGFKVRRDGQPYHKLAGEVTTRIKEWAEGMCVKHHVHNNLLKMYDKFGQVLRLETLLQNVREFKVYRAREGDPHGPKAYLQMRRGVSDLYGRAEVSQKINERYAASLATVEEKTPLAELTQHLGQRTRWKGRSVRALNPLAAEDAALLQAISRGEFLIQGFRNRDLRAHLCEAATTTAEAKRQAAKVTRLLRMLRAHGIIAKIAKTHRYQLTSKGRSSVSALLAARQANTQQLVQAG